MTPDWEHLASQQVPSPKSLTVTSLKVTLLPATPMMRLADRSKQSRTTLMLWNGNLCVPSGTTRKILTISTATKTLPNSVTTALCNGDILSTMGWCGMEKNGSNPTILTFTEAGNIPGNGRRTPATILPDQSLTTMWLGQTDHYHLMMGFQSRTTPSTSCLRMPASPPNLHCSHTRTTLLLFLGRDYQPLSVLPHRDQQPGDRHQVLAMTEQEEMFY